MRDDVPNLSTVNVAGRARRPARTCCTLSPAEPEDVVKAIAFGLRFESGRRVWQADEYMAIITAKRLIEHRLSTASLS